MNTSMDMHQLETAKREAEIRVSSALSRSTTPVSLPFFHFIILSVFFVFAYIMVTIM